MKNVLNSSYFLQIVVATLMLFAGSSVAGAVSQVGQSNGKSHLGATENEAWVENSSDSTWAVPAIDVTYKAFGKENTRTLKWNPGAGVDNCKWIPWYNPSTRVCARPAEAGEYGNKGDDRRLCAYEDPLDAFDDKGGGVDHGNYMYFHHNSTPDDAPDVAAAAAKGAVYGAAAGLVLGGPASPVSLVTGAAWGAMIGSADAYFQSKYNEVVNFHEHNGGGHDDEAIGCVDIPLAVGPDEFCNDCWYMPFWPTPEITLAPTSTFLEPNVKLTFCSQDGGRELDEGEPVQYPVVCQRDHESGRIVEDMNHHSIVLTPSAPDYEDTGTANPNDVKTKTDRRTFKAVISDKSPEEICVYAIANPAYSPPNRPTITIPGKTGLNQLQGCVPRPGYMPQPKLYDPESGDQIDISQMTQSTIEGGVSKISDPTAGNSQISTYENPGVRVMLAGQHVDLLDPVLAQDADSSNVCKNLHQIPFCARRKCEDDEPMGSKLPDGTIKRSCNQWSSVMCVTGYDRVPTVVETIGSGTPVPANGGRPGNRKIDAKTEFDNVWSIPEVQPSPDGEDVLGVYSLPAEKLKFQRSLLVYDPPFCYQRECTQTNDNGECERTRCVNYQLDDNADSGKCCTPGADTCMGREPFREGNGVCREYVRNIAVDKYELRDGERVRPLDYEDLDMCVKTQPEASYKIFDYVEGECCSDGQVSCGDHRKPFRDGNGQCIEYVDSRPPGVPQVNKPQYTHKYTVPRFCSQIEVHLWGAGGNGTRYNQHQGRFNNRFYELDEIDDVRYHGSGGGGSEDIYDLDGDDKASFSGRAGAYLGATVSVYSGETFTINVGGASKGDIIINKDGKNILTDISGGLGNTNLVGQDQMYVWKQAGRTEFLSDSGDVTLIADYGRSLFDDHDPYRARNRSPQQNIVSGSRVIDTDSYGYTYDGKDGNKMAGRIGLGMIRTEGSEGVFDENNNNFDGNRYVSGGLASGRYQDHILVGMPFDGLISKSYVSAPVGKHPGINELIGGTQYCDHDVTLTRTGGGSVAPIHVRPYSPTVGGFGGCAVDFNPIVTNQSIYGYTNGGTRYMRGLGGHGKAIIRCTKFED